MDPLVIMSRRLDPPINPVKEGITRALEMTKEFANPSSLTVIAPIFKPDVGLPTDQVIDHLLKWVSGWTDKKNSVRARNGTHTEEPTSDPVLANEALDKCALILSVILVHAFFATTIEIIQGNNHTEKRAAEIWEHIRNATTQEEIDMAQGRLMELIEHYDASRRDGVAKSFISIFFGLAGMALSFCEFISNWIQYILFYAGLANVCVGVYHFEIAEKVNTKTQDQLRNAIAEMKRMKRTISANRAE